MGVVYFLIALVTSVRARPAARRADLGRRPGCSWPSRSSGRSSPGRRRSSWRSLFEPEALLPDHRADGRRLVRRDERPAAADHAGRGRHPPDRRPRLGAHRVADRGHPRRHLRHPDRRGRLRVLLPLPAPRRRATATVAGPRARSGSSRARGPAASGSRASPAPGTARGRRGTPGARAAADPRRRPAPRPPSTARGATTRRT